jgi:hypothetical protein
VGFGALQLLQKPPPAPAPTPTPEPVPPPAPIPPAAPYHVTATAGLIVRTGPGTNYGSRGVLAYRTGVVIGCQTVGTLVGSSRIWDHIVSPIDGYVSDWWVSTPGVGVYSPGLPRCSGAPVTPPPTPAPGPKPPPAPAPPPAGKPPLTRWQDVATGWIVATSCTYGAPNYLIEPAGRGIDGLDWQYYEPAHRRRRWIADQTSWNMLTTGDRNRAGPRSAIHLVTQACMSSIAQGPELRWELRLRAAPGWAGNNNPRLAPSMAAAGWCG